MPSAGPTTGAAAPAWGAAEGPALPDLATLAAVQRAMPSARVIEHHMRIANANAGLLLCRRGERHELQGDLLAVLWAGLASAAQASFGAQPLLPLLPGQGRRKLLPVELQEAGPGLPGCTAAASYAMITAVSSNSAGAAVQQTVLPGMHRLLSCTSIAGLQRWFAQAPGAAAGSSLPELARPWAEALCMAATISFDQALRSAPHVPSLDVLPDPDLLESVSVASPGLQPQHGPPAEVQLCTVWAAKMPAVARAQTVPECAGLACWRVRDSGQPERLAALESGLPELRGWHWASLPGRDSAQHVPSAEAAAATNVAPAAAAAESGDTPSSLLIHCTSHGASQAVYWQPATSTMCVLSLQGTQPSNERSAGAAAAAAGGPAALTLSATSRGSSASVERKLSCFTLLLDTALATRCSGSQLPVIFLLSPGLHQLFSWKYMAQLLHQLKACSPGAIAQHLVALAEHFMCADDASVALLPIETVLQSTVQSDTSSAHRADCSRRAQATEVTPV